MKTEVLSHSADAIAKACELLQAGEVVALPTETVYGLAGNAFDQDSVLKSWLCHEGINRANDSWIHASGFPKSRLPGSLQAETSAGLYQTVTRLGVRAHRGPSRHGAGQGCSLGRSEPEPERHLGNLLP
ncbi:MAG: hypothetical protein EBX52_10885 [Proteobacteria bacterium]|nr:hypothetical protein [Pseudomonadota bacterium]